MAREENKWVDFWTATPEELEKKEKEKLKEIDIASWKRQNEEFKANSKNYVKVIFTKGKYHFVSFSGKKEIVVRVGKTFSTVACPKVSKRKMKFVGWSCDGQPMTDATVIDKTMILSPVFEKEN